MSQQISWLDSAPRVGAVAISALALMLLSQARPATFPKPSTAVAKSVVPAARPEAVSWDVRSGGWRIRLDGVVVAFPSAEEVISTDPAKSYRIALSAFDELITRHAEAEGFDWRLIAAIIYEESRFNPASVSPKGAFGLMQVREIAARDVGESQYWVPEDNVRAGVRYLSSLRREFRSPREEDGLRLAIAAYNVGPAHLRDAQQVATALGLNPKRWHNGIRKALPLLEREEVHSRLPYGFAQGSVTVGYVDRVWARYLEYQRATAVFAATEAAMPTAR